MILGVSITEDKIYIKSDEKNEVDSFPFVILRDTTNNSWHIGAKAYELSLLNKGILVDKIFYMIENNSYITISSQRYDAQNILDFFVKELMLNYETPEYITISLYKNNVELLNAIRKSFELVIPPDHIHITSNSEAFAYYMQNNSEEFLQGTVGLFDFSSKSLCYYELNRRTTKQNKYLYQVDKTFHPPIQVELLHSKTGDMLCDNLLKEFLTTVSVDKTYSCFLMSGVGFDNYTQYVDFINILCNICPHVLQESQIFAIGCYYISKHIVENTEPKNFYLTDMRTTCSIKLKVDNHNREYINICNIGEEWFYKNFEFNILVDDEEKLVFKIDDIINNKTEEIVYNLSNDLLPRQDKTNMMSLKLTFNQQNIFCIDIMDIGFGEFYPKTGVNKHYERTL